MRSRACITLLAAALLLPSIAAAQPRLIHARHGHTATTLADGRVLIAGGSAQTAHDPGLAEVTTSAELFDPRTGSVRLIGALTEYRVHHAAVLLRDGRVLIIGGASRPPGAWWSTLRSAEIWDPATERFTPVAPLATARRGHTATLLADGRVLVVGGAHDERHSRTGADDEIYDPTTDRWESAGRMSEPTRSRHSASLLPDGRVLVIGGDAVRRRDSVVDSATVGSGEVWSPALRAWSPAVTLRDARTKHTATTLADGSVLVAGGERSDRVFRTTEICTPAAARCRPGPTLLHARTGHTATVLLDGSIAILGGEHGLKRTEGTRITEVLRPGTQRWRAGPPLPKARHGHASVLLPDGRLAIIGGTSTEPRGPGEFLGSVLLWSPVRPRS